MAKNVSCFDVKKDILFGVHYSQDITDPSKKRNRNLRHQKAFSILLYRIYYKDAYLKSQINPDILVRAFP